MKICPICWRIAMDDRGICECGADLGGCNVELIRAARSSLTRLNELEQSSIAFERATKIRIKELEQALDILKETVKSLRHGIKI